MLKSETVGSELSEDGAIQRYLRPEPRVRLGTLVARNRAATGCIDLSDGLADAVRRIAEASGVGAVIDADAVPVAPAARRWFEAQSLDPVTAALTGGDDYELLVAVRPRDLPRFTAASGRSGLPLTRIGVCTADRRVLVRRIRGGVLEECPLPLPGFAHFR
jgi:thiamine-monophosphate kinase